MGGLLDTADRIARGEISVDEGLHDMAERLRPVAATAAGDTDAPHDTRTGSVRSE